MAFLDLVKQRDSCRSYLHIVKNEADKAKLPKTYQSREVRMLPRPMTWLLESTVWSNLGS